MSRLRQQLDALLTRFDDDAFVALANKGLLRRAQKDLEKQSEVLVEESAAEVVVHCSEHRIRFDARGPAHAICSCPASAVCQHILAAAIALKRMAGGVSPASPSGAPSAAGESGLREVKPISSDTDSAANGNLNWSAESGPNLHADGAPLNDPLAALQQTLLAMQAPELIKHAGKAGYRWAWQFVHDLDLEQALTIGGERNVVISFARPRMTLRYMGGGVESLIADFGVARATQVEKYRVAAVLAYQRANGIALTPPEPTAKERAMAAGALDLGADHRLAESSSAALVKSRARLRDSACQLIGESVELGLAHLSSGIHERYATLAVWAQGAEYYRLAPMLRRIADHVELLLDRAGGADEHRLLDEMTIAFGLVCALDTAARRGLAPPHLVGRARSRYEGAGSLELLGLGASAWRSQTGYRGLTMVFWSPAERSFVTCTDARPASERSFDPLARYKSAGPWSGLGAPMQAIGRRVVLTGAQSNETGRLSAAESTAAIVLPMDRGQGFAEKLQPCTSWSELMRERSERRRSLIAEPQPMKDWVVLAPARFGPAKFDNARQTLMWPLFDGEANCLVAELEYSEYTRHAIGRIEGLSPANLNPGTLVVARMQSGLVPVAEPLSLVHPAGASRSNPVDALYFDAPPEQGMVSKLLERLRGGTVQNSESRAAVLAGAELPRVLTEYRHHLCREAERGIAADYATQSLALAASLNERATASGLTAFNALSGDERAGLRLVKANYVCIQFARLLGASAESEDGSA